MSRVDRRPAMFASKGLLAMVGGERVRAGMSQASCACARGSGFARMSGLLLSAEFLRDEEFQDQPILKLKLSEFQAMLV